MSSQQGETSEPRTSSRVVHISLPGLILFCVSLVVASGLLTFGLLQYSKAQPVYAAKSAASPLLNDEPDQAGQIPAWGQLLTYDIELEQPEEYAAFEVQSDMVEGWTFDGLQADSVKKLLIECGLSSNEVAHALSPELASTSATGTVIRPDSALLFSLSSSARGKLYAALAKSKSNITMRFPWFFPADSFNKRFGNGAVENSTYDLLKKVLYPLGGMLCFSDYDGVMRRITSQKERFRLVKALSRQSAVLARLRIRPDTDVDKLLGYWNRGAQEKDLRPLVESVKRLDGGGALSLLYFLPPFPRGHLNTFPMPSKPGDPTLDCHWSTMNFFNQVPDNRFGTPGYMYSYITEHYYQIAEPSLYGDIVLFIDDNGDVVHSGVYLASDLVYSKNGNSFVQPWKIMRLQDLKSVYAMAVPTKVLFFRNKDY